MREMPALTMGSFSLASHDTGFQDLRYLSNSMLAMGLISLDDHVESFAITCATEYLFECI